MPSLKANFNELAHRIRQGRDLHHAGFEPVYYLVFSPREILEVKRNLPGWLAQLQMDGWEVHCVSLAEEIAQILDASPARRFWLSADAKAPLAWDKTNQALANALTGSNTGSSAGSSAGSNARDNARGALQSRLAAALDNLKQRPDALLLVTDLEALHPYARIGTIEGQLAGEFVVPTVFFYPGVRTGKSRLSFLGFYPEDGNYRSVHIGG